jgi:type I restriction enzyme M protein
LIAFINQEMAPRPDGKEGAGLFAHLRGLQSPEGRGREEVVANVFRGVSNRMESGYR